MNETVTNTHKSSMNEDLRDDIGAAAVNETINKNHNVNLNESAMEVDSKGAKASKSTMKGAGKKYVKQSINTFLKLTAKQEKQRKQSKKKNSITKRWIHY